MLYVDGKNRTKLAEGLALQITAVKAALRRDDRLSSVLVYPALCFVGTEWPRSLAPFDVHGVNVVNPRELRDFLKKRGSLSQDVLELAYYVLAKALPPAHH